ncbi:MAG: hypothetical protein LBF80_04240 [Spirochaetaceae bacterium]|nr:hypothetical protein [Spirochaetaceae bacterium]
MKRAAGIVITVLGLLPLVSILLWTFVSRWPLTESLPVLSVKAWHILDADDFYALLRAASYSALVAFVSCALAVAVSRSLLNLGLGTATLFEAFFCFPALLPVLSVVLGTHQFSLRVLGGSLTVPMFLLYTFFSFPYAFRLIYPPYRAGINPVREIAFTLGADSLQTFFFVEFPLLVPFLGTAFVFSYSVAYGQYLIEAFFLADTSKVFSVPMAETLTGANRSASAVFTLYYTLFGIVALGLPPAIDRIRENEKRKKRKAGNPEERV